MHVSNFKMEEGGRMISCIVNLLILPYDVQNITNTKSNLNNFNKANSINITTSFERIAK